MGCGHALGTPQGIRAALAGLAAAAVIVLAGHAAADRLPAPEGDVILTISGNIAHTTDGERAEFDIARIEALGLVALSTSNPFVEGVQHFEGVPLARLLDHVGAEGETLVSRALDGYVVDIPVADVRNYPVILATRRDGRHMHVRQKGPLWVIYPVDEFDELRTEVYSGRTIWQLRTIRVE